MSIAVLIVDDEENARTFIGDFLAIKGYEIIQAATLAEARACVQRGDADVILLDVTLPDGYGPNLLYETATMAARPPVIMITAHKEIEIAVDAMKNGAFDFFTKPVDLNLLEKAIQRAGEIISMRRELVILRASRGSAVKFVAGGSETMKRVLLLAQKAAQFQSSVLITGESGTGKDVLARYIRDAGPRRDEPYIPINCAAIQPTMLESELFGYEAGAFTGAEKRKHGLVEVANRGILFLDEISSMTVDVQAKLLRVLEEKAFRRVGATTLTPMDVQVVAASNRDLPTMIKQGTFREDLYYRLKIVDLHIPALRERTADIPELVGFFIRELNGLKGMNVRDVTPQALEALSKFRYPGNIRQLRNSIESSMLMCNGEIITLADLPADIIQETRE